MDAFPSLQSSITSSLVATTRSASQLASADLPFHRSLDASLGAVLDKQNARLLFLAQRLLGSATATAESVRQPPRLSDIDAVDGNWRQVVDVVDSLLERADTALDEFTGAVRRLSPDAEGKIQKAGVEKMGGKVGGAGRIATGFSNQEIEKPQLRFAHLPTNDEAVAFAPLLKSKPHATVPLHERKAGEHPYRNEIGKYAYPASVYTQAVPVPYHSFEDTTAIFVDTEDAMYEMLDEIKQAKEIAIDLEHHDQRSYIGLVSLMQISTRDKDWIVDTLKPWRRQLQALNEVFADPRILKVLHGAYMDIMWLQRDLGLYIVGLFDTHYASRALGYSGGSLAFLLKKFVDVDAQKQYQMADWRIRPLPQELYDYARSDTHYLLYIFDNMRNELIQRSDFSKPNQESDKLWDVLQRSSETALQTYEHPIYDSELGQGPAGWYKLLARTPALLSKEQFSVFRAVHKWRDDVAREQDDSVHYIMPNHQIFSLAKGMPVSRAEVLNTAHPATQTVRLRADELVGVIVRAQEESKDGPEMMEVLNKIEPQVQRKAPAPKEQPATSHSVAAFLPQQQQQPPVTVPVNGTVSVASALPLRSATSAFWGSTFAGSAQPDRRAMSTTPNVTLTVPLPPFTAEVFADPTEMQSTPVRLSEPTSPEPTPVEVPNEQDNVFILKEMGKKRRHAAADLDRDATDGMAANSDKVVLYPDAESERSREKAERKSAKKEAKRVNKAADVVDGTDGADEEPFDYEAAPSILKQPRESREGARERRKKVVNPYAKSMDAPKGLGRAQKERAGRSMTFKS